jgi:hypothetical protein
MTGAIQRSVGFVAPQLLDASGDAFPRIADELGLAA